MHSLTTLLNHLWKQPARKATSEQMKKLCVLLKGIPEPAWRDFIFQRSGVESRTQLTLIDCCDLIDRLENGDFYEYY